MDRAALLEALERETSSLAAALEHVDLDARVPACPEWDVRELAAHVAGVHRWATHAVADGEMREDPTPPLPDRASVVAWYAQSAQRLRQVLAATPAGTPCPGFGPPPRTVDFWVRRQAHEAAVHRWDVEVAAGGAPVLDAALSADGVDEVVGVMLPRQVRLGRTALPTAAVALEQADGDGRWVVGEGPPAATLRADAATLLLLLWRRTSLDAEQVDGDPSAAAALLAAALTP